MIVENDRIIWLNGELVNVQDAKINVLSPTSQFGLNVFEGIPCYWNDSDNNLYAFRLDDHFDRLIRSASLLGIECKYTKDELKDAFISAIKANNYKENLSVRQTLFVYDFGTWSSHGPTGMFVAPIPKRKTSIEYNKDYLNVCISSFVRISEKNISPKIKCGANYINSRVGQLEAINKGYDTCIFLNEKGTISEAPGSCFFMVKDEKIITPTLDDSILDSITRRTIIEIARGLSMVIKEEEISIEDMKQCDEAFLCGSSMSITKIKKIDDKELDVVNNKITDKLIKAYLDVVCGKNSNYFRWLTKIY